jgi:hypothetical protein
MTIVRAVWRAALVRSRQEALDALPPEYFASDFDPVAGELAMLPRMFSEADLEAVVEERSAALEARCLFWRSLSHACMHPRRSQPLPAHLACTCLAMIRSCHAP